MIAQAVVLRRQFNGLELDRLLSTTARILLASLALALISYGVWHVLAEALGGGFFGQLVSLGLGLGVGAAAYLGLAKALRIAELEQILRLLPRR